MHIWDKAIVGSLALLVLPVLSEATEGWDPTRTTGAPAARSGHSAVWTGQEMIVWGGLDAHFTAMYTGGVYDPETNAWMATSTAGAPLARYDHTAVWTGQEMIVWGGNVYGPVNTGGIYDLATDTWSATSTTGAPAGRSSYAAAWTGSKMFVWGGYDRTYLNTGGVYDPETDTWTATSTTGAPSVRAGHTAVGTGQKIIVWGGRGGEDGSGNPVNTGGIYDPETDTWTAMTTTGAPAARAGHTGVWTGSKMVVWGGYDGRTYLNTGGVYDPETDTWTATSTTDAPSERSLATGVWTGSKLIVWGGALLGGGVPGAALESNTGGIFDPATDAWTPTSTTGAPSRRVGHTAVWTGQTMIVWGGSPLTNTGGIFTPPERAVSSPPVPYDFDYDLNPDILWHHQAGGNLYVWFMNSVTQTSGSFLTPGAISNPAWQIRGIADFNHDGKIDILWHNQGGGDLYVWFMDGLKQTWGSYLTPNKFSNTQWQIRGVGDLNADGESDILWHNQVTGYLYVWYMDGLKQIGGSYLTPNRIANTAWQIRGLADFDDDGDLDVLWHNQSGGDLYVWFMNGVAQAGGSYLTPSKFSNTAWQIRELADFNGDDEIDILWHNQVTGHLYVWYLSGLNKIGGSYLSPDKIANTSWQIAPR